MILRKLAAVVAISALLAAACGTPDPVVATVNGVEVHQSDVVELRSTDPDAVVLDSANFRNELFGIIVQQVLATALERDFGVTISSDEVEAELAARLEESGISEEEAIASLQDPAATRERLLRIVYSGLLGERATSVLATRGGFAVELIEDSPELITTVCSRHILVETEQAAQAVAARLEAGDDFGAVADEVSLDAGAGGDLGCSYAGRYDDAFAAATLVAPLGEVFGPVETGFGWHLIEVTDRSAPTMEEIEADPTGTLPPDLLQAEFNNWFNDQVDGADVSVSSRIGTWFPDGPGIHSPVAP